MIEKSRILRINEEPWSKMVDYTEDEMEIIYKHERGLYLDAYRKYQAAVNYGEFERVPALDSFITRLLDKDWSAFDNVPKQILYFTGEKKFFESGLDRRN